MDPPAGLAPSLPVALLQGPPRWATVYRHENPSPFGEIRRFETKIGDLRESWRSEGFLFWGGGGGQLAGRRL